MVKKNDWKFPAVNSGEVLHFVKNPFFPSQIKPIILIYKFEQRKSYKKNIE